MILQQIHTNINAVKKYRDGCIVYLRSIEQYFISSNMLPCVACGNCYGRHYTIDKKVFCERCYMVWMFSGFCATPPTPPVSLDSLILMKKRATDALLLLSVVRSRYHEAIYGPCEVCLRVCSNIANFGEYKVSLCNTCYYNAVDDSKRILTDLLFLKMIMQTNDISRYAIYVYMTTYL